MLTLNKLNILKMLSENIRADGRAFHEYRKIEIIPNYIKESAEGSALVKIGSTKVLAGIKLDVEKPFPDSEDEGILITSSELVPIAYEEFEEGPPRENAIELSRIVDRGIRESKMIDLKSLCIVPKEKVWTIFIDIHVLDYDGNLIDASFLASLVALFTARIPEYDIEEDKIIREKRNKKLKILDIPITVTARKIGEKIILDSTKDEEDVENARLSVTFKKNGNICAIQKGGSSNFSFEELREIIPLLSNVSKDIRVKVERVLRGLK